MILKESKIGSGRIFLFRVVESGVMALCRAVQKKERRTLHLSNTNSLWRQQT